MASSFLSLTPHLLISPSPRLTTPPNPLHHTQFLASPHHYHYHNHKHCLHGSLCVARLGFNPGPSFPDPDCSEAVIGDLFGRAQGLLYTIADAAVSTSDSVNGAKQNSDWLSGITNTMETVLKVLKDGLSYLHVPYTYGFAIILLTVLVKAATFPLSKKQVESTMAMRSLQPQIKAIQQRYAGDQERIQLETARLYKLAGINPLAGCLPTLATIPVWIGLYRALSNVADEGLLTEGFFWIPSLSGPTTVAARQSGSGISWLFPFIDGHPPLGWSDTLAYLVLPVTLVVLQYISVQSMQSSQNNDPSMKNSQALTKFLPLMIGYFALSVPSGLSLYWLTNNILTTTQQVWLQKLGGAKNPVRLPNDELTKDELPQAQKPTFEANPTKNETQQKEKLTSQGPQPGERFKQIKEQEARRRREREEEKRKAAVVTANGVQVITEGDQKKPNLGVRSSGDGAESVDGMNEDIHSASVVRDSSSTGVNGVLSTRDSNGELSSNCKGDVSEEHHSHEILEKEKTVEAYTSKPPSDTELPGGDANQAREEQLARRED